MKNQYIFPAAAALIGFSIAWVAKPSNAIAPVKSETATEAAAPVRNTRTSSENRSSAADSKRPAEVRAGDFPLVKIAEEGPQNREEAKMLRLTEALGLTIDQQGEIIRLVEESHANAVSEAPVIEDLAARGKALEEAFAKLMTPDQLAKFEELRVRERENRIEARAHKALTEVIEEVDLSPEQREQVLDRLRQSAKAELQAIPNSATLLFEKSVLPTGKNELSVDGVLMLAKMGEPILYDDPVTAQNKVLQRQREELEQKLKNFDGILTPAQMGQYYATVAEQKAILSKIPANTSTDAN